MSDSCSRASCFKSLTQLYHTGYLPLPSTFRATDKLLKKYLAIKDKTNSKRNMVLDFWSDYYEIIKHARSVWKESRILNGLPDIEEQISHILEHGGSAKQHYNRSIRDVSWLEENGTSRFTVKCIVTNFPGYGATLLTRCYTVFST